MFGESQESSPKCIREGSREEVIFGLSLKRCVRIFYAEIEDNISGKRSRLNKDMVPTGTAPWEFLRGGALMNAGGWDLRLDGD